MAARISFLDLRFFAFPRRSFLAMTICLFLTTAFTMQFLCTEGKYGRLALSCFFTVRDVRTLANRETKHAAMPYILDAEAGRALN